SGLQYNRERFYDPQTGRWESQDPLGFDAGDPNPYPYVHNDPTEGADPGGVAGRDRGQYLVDNFPTVYFGKIPPARQVPNIKYLVGVGGGQKIDSPEAVKAQIALLKFAQAKATRFRGPEVTLRRAGQDGEWVTAIRLGDVMGTGESTARYISK